MNLSLIKASKEYESLILEMLSEWKEYNLDHDDVNKSPWAIFREYDTFENFIKMLNDDEDISKIKPGLVPSSTYFLLDNDRHKVVGATNIRHYLNESLRNGGGHIGDGIRPSERGKGYGKAIIALALEKCKELGIKEVLMACHSDNPASRKTILANKGIYERTIPDEDKELEQYWIKL